ncbi:hypothetical protein Tco_1123551 [Tanacetum coccineum]|uniref:Retrotransposon gag domain-containing protein n=1 Tax=Tanacetum coccineum TaxID=301880 RepID=A0ABQ5J3P5_9ASTR
MLDSQGFIPMMTPAQAFKSIQVMSDHSHNWYDGAATRQRSNDSSDDIDMQELKENIYVIQVSCKICEGTHLTQECPLRKKDEAVEQIKYIGLLKETINKYCEESLKRQAANDEWIRKFVENTDLNLRAIDTATKNLQVLGKNMGGIDINTLTMEQYITLIQDKNSSGLLIPEIGNDVDFEIKSHFMKELRRNLFAGTDDKDAHEHVRRVLEISDLFHIPSVTYDANMLKVFPITLIGAALRWKNRLPAGKLKEIGNFKQGMDEMLYQAWERYNDLLYRCSQHDLNSQQKVQIFYTGLGIPSRKMLDSQGFIPMMTPAQAYKSIQVMADHSHNWYNEATTRQRSNDSSDDIDMQELKKNFHVIQETINKYYEESIKRQATNDDWIRKFIENTTLNLRAIDAATKNPQVLTARGLKSGSPWLVVK